MTVLLYMQDSYVREFDAQVQRADGKKAVLDKSYFYPGGGGQERDDGIIKKGKSEFRAVGAKKEGSDIIMEVDKEGLSKGDAVHVTIDWERRYAFMRNHTAAHVISAIIHAQTGALITGNQLGLEQSRIDFNVEEFSSDIAQQFIDKANEEIAKGHDVAITNMLRNEVEKTQAMSKLAKGLPNLQEFRIVKIGDIDTQADGGCHVRNTREIGKLELVKTENKGKSNRRIYFRLV